MAELTPKQKMFVKEYLRDLNATQAAIRAGYSKRTAMEQGYQLIHKTSVAKAIEKATDARIKRTEITAEFVLNGIKEVAERRGIKENDTLKAYELLGKHLKLFTERIEETSDQNLNINFNIPRPKRD